MILVMLACVTFASCGGAGDRSDASTADSNRIDTGRTKETSEPNPNDHGIGDTTGTEANHADTPGQSY